MQTLSRLSLCLLFLVAGAGCVAVPIPLPKTVVAGEEITSERTAFITPGSTHREDVIRELGEPYAEFPDLKIVAYKWEMHEGVVIWGAAGGGAAGGGTIDMLNYYSLLIAYDPADRVRDVRGDKNPALEHATRAGIEVGRGAGVGGLEGAIDVCGARDCPWAIGPLRLPGRWALEQSRLVTH